MVNDSFRVHTGMLAGCLAIRVPFFIQLCKNTLWSSQAEIHFLKSFFLLLFFCFVLGFFSASAQFCIFDGGGEKGRQLWQWGFGERQMGMRNGPSSPVLS